MWRVGSGGSESRRSQEERWLDEEVVLDEGEVEGGIRGRAEMGKVEEGGDMVGIVREERERVGREGRESRRAVEEGIVEKERKKERGGWWSYV